MDATLLESVTMDAPAALPMKTTKPKRKPATYENVSVLYEADEPVDPSEENATTTPPHWEQSEQIPSPEQRPKYIVFDEPTNHGSKRRAGLWFFGMKAGRGENASATPIESWICGPLHIDALTCDTQDNNHGRLLRFLNASGNWRRWSMPMEMLAGAGDEYRTALLNQGLQIDPNHRGQMGNYFSALVPQTKVLCATQTGWFKGSFVLPDEVIGPDAGDVIFQSNEVARDEFTRAGNLTQWRESIAAKATGNPLLILALSAAFSGPLLARCNAEGGGVHFVADSSIGKTTLINAACSVWGGENYRRSWRSTSNGMEGVAALFNDNLLALDEISECDPKDAGPIVYALGNGRGKQRSSRTGAARGVTRWKCAILSSGERTVETHMMEGGKRAKAGQQVRLVDLHVMGKYGAWDELHGQPSPAQFSDALKSASANHHGHAGRAFLEKLTRDERDFGPLLEAVRGSQLFPCDPDDGQAKRVAARFAMIGMAGELATEYGLTDWADDAAMSAASACFAQWKAGRNTGNAERGQIAEQLAAFIDKHGDSRFSSADTDGAMTVRDRAGWWKSDGSDRVYLFTADGLREALHGFDFKRALVTLQQSGAMESVTAKQVKVTGRNCRVYTVASSKVMRE